MSNNFENHFSQPPDKDPPPAGNDEAFQSDSVPFDVTPDQDSKVVDETTPDVISPQGTEQVSTGATASAETPPQPQTLDQDVRYRQLSEELSLQHLKTKDSGYFYSKYSGDVSPNGYLLDRQGKETNFLPSQNISGEPWGEVSAKAKAEFQQRFPEEFQKYEQAERTKVYDKITDDPAYRKMEEEITRRTNTDGAVRGAMREGRASGGEGYSAAWDRAAIRERLNGLDDFARSNPEKALAYTERWNQYVQQNPEVAEMWNSQWEQWCNTNPGASEMSEYRGLARVVEQKKRNSEIKLKNKSIGEAPPDSPIQREATARRDILRTTSAIELIKLSTSPELEGADDATLEAEQEKLKELPYYSGNDVRDILDYQGDDEGLKFVDTTKIVGSVSPAFEDWSTEYESRKGRVVGVAKGLLKPNDASVERIFHLKKPNEQIKLKKITGPGGDVFFAQDGTHRVAGSKLARLAAIPARIENMNKVSEVYADDKLLAEEWQGRIKKGLITGTVTQEKNRFKLTIEKQALPWMHLPQAKLKKFSKFYESVYPGSLDKVGIPKDALLDDVGYNYFMADRYEEYEQKRKAG